VEKRTQITKYENEANGHCDVTYGHTPSVSTCHGITSGRVSTNLVILFLELWFSVSMTILWYIFDYKFHLCMKLIEIMMIPKKILKSEFFTCTILQNVTFLTRLCRYMRTPTFKSDVYCPCEHSFIMCI
jgi:hypothetical protein